MDNDRFEKIKFSPELATVDDVRSLIADCERIHWDYTDVMRLCDERQKRILEMENIINRLRHRLTSRAEMMPR